MQTALFKFEVFPYVGTYAHQFRICI